MTAEEPLSPPRRVELSGCFNFRDLGGYHTKDGRRLRWRRLFRADGLHRLDEGDCAVLAEMGLATVIDLRTEGEVEQRGNFPFDLFAVEYHHLPLTDVLPPEHELTRYGEPAFVTARYLELFASGTPSLRRAVELLASDDALPAVFHCSAGKDRTGILAALVLGFLGVPEDVIVEDYALSAHGMVKLMESIKAEFPENAEAVERYAPAVTTVSPHSMDHFLRSLADDHGDFEQLATTWGVTGAVERLRLALLE